MPTIENLLQGSTLKEQYALIYTPSRKRQRFPANCVFPEADMLYYLIQWLDISVSG